jgi:hypothetical protein
MVAAMKEVRPDIKVWLDLEQFPTEEGMKAGVMSSKTFLFYCTTNIASSAYCMKELGWAVAANKRIILVQETDPRHGATDIGMLKDRVSVDLQFVFEENVAISWHRDPDHRRVSVKKILACIFEDAGVLGSHPFVSMRSKSDLGRSRSKLDDSRVQIAVATSGFDDPHEAVENAYGKLVRELKGNAPTVVICNQTCQYKGGEVQTALSQLHSQFLGCTSSAGIIANQSWHCNDDRGFGLFGLYDPGGTYSVGHCEKAADIDEASQAALQNSGQDSSPDFIILFPAPDTEEQIIAGIEKAVGEKVPMIGGSSADNTIAGEWYQISSALVTTAAGKCGGVSNAGAVFCMCWPSVLTHAGFCSGFSPTSHQGKITKMHDRRHIATIDGKAAALVYNEWTAGAVKTNLADREDSNVLGVSTLSPLGVQYGKDLDGEPMYVVIHPHLVVQKDKSLTTFKDLKEGQVLVCMAGTRQNLVTRLSKVASELLKSATFDKDDIIGSYQIFCGGVMMAIKEDMPKVAEKLGVAVDWKPTLGVCTFGEQGTFIDGCPGHGNLMFSSLVFSRIRKTSIPSIIEQELGSMQLGS